MARPSASAATSALKNLEKEYITYYNEYNKIRDEILEAIQKRNLKLLKQKMNQMHDLQFGGNIAAKARGSIHKLDTAFFKLGKESFSYHMKEVRNSTVETRGGKPANLKG